ncbi:glycosyltransferase [Limibacillus sp. MBR-115]|jgi:predicted glycosyltransferase|uniref:glycosyltransferase family protein n=1 Tax=Limibacillus sp. MBR-115 TaxID=3156465 RepID=UPI0033924B08
MKPKVLLYVQHLLGIGHLKRAALLARGMTDAGFHVVFVSGGEPHSGLDLGAAEPIQLAPCHVRDESFQLLDETGTPVSADWQQRRRDHLLSILQEARPDVLLVELFPFGRRQMRFELLPLLEAAREQDPSPLVFCSVRDILSKIPSPERQAWIVDVLGKCFDGVLVHGDRSFIPFDATFPATHLLESKLHYTGYVTTTTAAGSATGAGRGEVLVSTGGGAVAGPLLEAALAARPLTSLATAPWRLLAGRNFPEESFQRLRKQALETAGGVILERARPDFQQLLANCLLSISQAGYNTTLEVLAAGPRAVLVPYAAGEEGEQSLRAALLAKQGLLTVVEESGLSGTTLAAGIEMELRRPRIETAFDLDLEGAAHSASVIRQALDAKRQQPDR